MNKQTGFTLMELIIVIVILGILSAFAIPKYMSLDVEARTATVKGLKGSMMAAAEMVHGVALAKGKKSQAPGTIDLGGGLIVNVTANAYPTATLDGIGNALTSTSGFQHENPSTTSINYYADGGAVTTCTVTYSVPAGNATPDISSVNTGC